MSDRSLRGRLLAWLLGSLALAGAAVIGLAYLQAHRQLDAVLDAHLARSAQLLIAQGSDELDEIHVDRLDVGPYDQAIAFQVWHEGRLVLRTAEAPATRLSPVEDGFSDSGAGGRRWRVYSGWDRDKEVLVQVAEDIAGRERLLRFFALSSLPVLAISLPVLGLVIWLVVGAAFRPLAALGEEVGRRSAADLGPLEAPGAPAEVRPLVDRLNTLFAGIRESLQAERRFTSHAAHELRTPIAAIRAQAEVASRESGAAAEAALRRVIEGCDRAARLVDQMLLLARLDEPPVPEMVQGSRLDRVAADVLAGLAPVALEQGVTLELVAEQPVPVALDPGLVAVLVRNLAENAVRHGGPPGPVVVRCLPSGGGAWLEVEDSGPGVPAAERSRLGRRFFRAAAATGDGSGLGLSIVDRIAARCGAEVTHGPGREGGGWVVRVHFPEPSRNSSGETNTPP